MRSLLILSSLFALCSSLSAAPPDFLNPEFPSHPPEPVELPLFAQAAAGEPAAAPAEEEWELLYPRTTYASGGILGGLLLYWLSGEVDIGANHDDPSPTPAQLAAQDQAAVASGAGGPQLTRRLMLSGSFLGGAMALDCGDFVPGLTFSGSFADLGSGAISGHASSATCSPLGAAQAGRQWTWRQVSDTDILVTGSDPFYVGRCRANLDGSLVLPNRITLSGGAVSEAPLQ